MAPTSWLKSPTAGSRRHIEAWVNAQDPQWTWFVTFTFRQPAKLSRAWRCWYGWVRGISKAMPWTGSQKRRDQVPWLAVAEKHGHIDGYHLHALVAGVERLDRPKFEALWDHGRAEISEFVPRLGGLRYVLKNIDRGADFDWSYELVTKEHLHR